jgi:hypothetical protein
MAYNFLRGDRDQPFLLPPDLRDWLPQDHLAWFVLDVVDQLDLAPFYRAHRDDGHGVLRGVAGIGGRPFGSAGRHDLAVLLILTGLVLLGG